MKKQYTRPIYGGRANKYFKHGGSDDFPYKRLFIKETPQELFQTLKSDLLFDIIKQNGDLIYIDGNRAYDLMDIVTDLFAEKVRVRTAIYGQMSPYKYWQRNKSKVYSNAHRVYQNTNPKSLRESLYRLCKEATLFKTSLVRYIMETYLDHPGHVMDPFAGWGDRLIGCLASDKVLSYTGTDTNKYMKPVYENIIDQLDGEKATVHIMDFMKFDSDSKYDIIFTSPPFFDFEGYTDLQLTQSTYEAWLDEWMLPAMIKMIDLLAEDGKLMLYVGGTYRTKNFDNEIVRLLVDHYGEKYHISKLSVYSTASGNKRPIYIVYVNKALPGGYVGDVPGNIVGTDIVDVSKREADKDKIALHPTSIKIVNIQPHHFDDIKDITSNEDVMKWVAAGRTWSDKKIHNFIKYNIEEQKQSSNRENFSFGVQVVEPGASASMDTGPSEDKKNKTKLVAVISIHKAWHSPSEDDPLKDAFFITRFVHKNYQRKKIASRATKQVIAEVRQLLGKDIPIYADVRQDNTAMNGYHQHVGNELIDETVINGKKYNRYKLKE